MEDEKPLQFGIETLLWATVLLAVMLRLHVSAANPRPLVVCLQFIFALLVIGAFVIRYEPKAVRGLVSGTGVGIATVLAALWIGGNSLFYDVAHGGGKFSSSELYTFCYTVPGTAVVAAGFVLYCAAVGAVWVCLRRGKVAAGLSALAALLVLHFAWLAVKAEFAVGGLTGTLLL